MHDLPAAEAPQAPDLTGQELVDLVQRVFAPGADETHLAILVDLPDQHTPDHEEWQDRRRMAAAWQRRLLAASPEGRLTCRLFAYRNVRANNADLPGTAWDATEIDGVDTLTLAESTPDGPLGDAEEVPFEEIFRRFPMAIALSQFSATAPLKLMSAKLGFRAATMPGFNRSMVDALRLDYTEVDRRVRLLATRLDTATAARFHFAVDGRDHRLTLDLRHRRAHPSGGLVRQAGQAGNLPSGETYIVPYEGEIEGDRSQSQGFLPVQLDDEVVLYRIEQNQAVEVIGQGPRAEAERRALADEPAYGNLAELGLGVLADFGIQPVGRILLDEKLGLHIAFGRSDHFGGQVGAAQFTRPEAVVHIDRVYLPETQAKIRVVSVDLDTPEGLDPLMRDGNYV